MEIYLSIVNLGWHCSFSEIKKCIVSANMQFFKKNAHMDPREDRHDFLKLSKHFKFVNHMPCVVKQ